MNGSQRSHLFFDSTEVKNPKADSPRLGRIAEPELRNAAAEIGAKLYVPDLVIGELACQRVRHFKDTYRTAARVIKPYVSIGDEPDEKMLLQKFSDEIKAALSEVPATVIPTSVTLAHTLALSDEEISFSPRKKPMGFRDALILLSSLKYAQENGLREFWFISNDNGFNDAVVSDFAAKQGILCKLIKDVSHATQLMTEMHAFRISSLDTDLAKAAVEFMNTHLEDIQKYLDGNPLQRSQILRFLSNQPLSVELLDVRPLHFPGTPVQITSSIVDRVNTAFPEAPPTEGTLCSLTFHAQVNVLLAVPRFSAVQTSPYYGTFIYGATGMIHLPSSLSAEEITLPVVGKVQANFENGRFVGLPIIKSVSVEEVPETSE